MTFVRNIRSVASAVAAIALVATALPSAASAQDLFSFLFGGSGGYNGEQVAFSSRYSPRQIIVSFGDRKLYWINKRGQAMS